MSDQIIYDTITRDLCRLACDRSTKAVGSVLQLADSPSQRAAIAMQVMGAAAGFAAAAYAEWAGRDPAGFGGQDFMEAFFAVAREEAVKAKAHGL